MSVKIGSSDLFTEALSRLHSESIFEEDMTRKDIHKENQFGVDMEA